MKTNELMIGDWVLHEGEPYQIRQLWIYGVDRDGAEYVIQETMKWLKNADDYISNDEDGRAHLLKGILIDNYKKHFMKRS